MAVLPRAGRCVGLAACALLVGSQGLQNAVAEGDTRTISFHHLHTGENLTITYKRDGRFDEDALKKINHEMRDWRRDEEVRMDPRVIDTIWEVNRDVGGKDPIQIVCGYRAPATNQMLRRRSRGVAQFSQHTLGKAVDFYIPGVPLDQLRAAGLRLQRGGVGFYPTSGSPFVHLDVGSVRHWPRMTHDQLARVFPNGRTVHVPSDGHPLAGYALALADLNKRGVSPSQTSLEAARSAGIAVAQAPKRSLLASLFSTGRDEDEDNETASTPAPSAAAPAAPAAPSGRTLAAASTPVPLPIARPVLREAAAKPANGSLFALASAESRPVELSAAARESTANNLFAARGMWEGPQGRPEPPASIPEPAQSQVAVGQVAASQVAANQVAAGQIASAQDGSVQLVPVRVASAAPEPESPRMRVEARPSDLDLTGGVTPWPSKVAGTDRVPVDIALAYAARNDGVIATPVSRAAPMGATAARKAGPASAMEPDSATTVVKKTATRPAVATRPMNPPPAVAPVAVTLAGSAVGPGATYEDPWLRAMVLAPDLQNYLTVTAFEPPDPSQLRALMSKPDAAVVMTFSSDPHLGVTCEHFSGSAVVFVSTVTFSSRTAMLR